MQDATLTQLAVIFLAGFAGSFHCIGMCGGFACALGRDQGRSRASNVFRHLLYNSGRLVSYIFLGSIAGALGSGALAADDGGTVAQLAQRTLALFAGVLMILMGLQLLGRLQRLHAMTIGGVGQTVAASLRGMLRTPGRAAPLAFGVFNGFLPCPLVYAFVALAAATAHPAHGALLMAVFGLGTFPAMLASGGLGTWLGTHWRLRGVRVAGVFILLLGTITLARGLVPMDGHGVHGLPDSIAGIELTLPAPHPGGHRH